MQHAIAVALLVLVALSLPVRADRHDLTLMVTGDDARGWEAVGRLDLGGRGFCTGALIATDLVLTAAHCLYDRDSGERIDPAEIELVGEITNMIKTAQTANLKGKAASEEAASLKNYRSSVKVVAGAGFEPATFRL